jgi:hypothetical protein
MRRCTKADIYFFDELSKMVGHVASEKWLLEQISVKSDLNSSVRRCAVPLGYSYHYQHKQPSVDKPDWPRSHSETALVRLGDFGKAVVVGNSGSSFEHMGGKQHVPPSSVNLCRSDVADNEQYTRRRSCSDSGIRYMNASTDDIGEMDRYGAWRQCDFIAKSQGFITQLAPACILLA